MKKILKNAVMNEMLRQLKPVLTQRNMIGYIAARNYRNLSDTLTEYEKFRNDLINKYGEADTDENGNPIVSIKMGTEAFRDFSKELEPLNNIEHEVELMMARYEDAIGILSGEEILNLDWMFED